MLNDLEQAQKVRDKERNKPTVKAITKEEFLDNTTEEEVFSLIHEFKERYNELIKEDNKTASIQDFKSVFNPLDKDIRIISEQMITEIKSQTWLQDGELKRGSKA